METERERINKSTYQAVPKTATVGTAADNPEISNAVKAAIATGSIESCKATIAQLKDAANAAAMLTPMLPLPEVPAAAPEATEAAPAPEAPASEAPAE